MKIYTAKKVLNGHVVEEVVKEADIAGLQDNGWTIVEWAPKKDVATAARCPDCGETNPAEIHTCSPQNPASVEPVAWEACCIGPRYAREVFKTRKEAEECADAWDRCAIRPLFTAPPDAEALKRQVAELQYLVFQMSAALERTRAAFVIAVGDKSPFAKKALAIFDAALAARKEG